MGLLYHYLLYIIMNCGRWIISSEVRPKKINYVSHQRFHLNFLNISLKHVGLCDPGWNPGRGKKVFSKMSRPALGAHSASYSVGRLLLKCDGTRAETRFCLKAKRTSPFKSAGASVQSTTGSRGARISGSNVINAGYTMFQRWCEGYWLPTPFGSFPFTSPPCVTMCHHVSTGLYQGS